MFGGPLDAPSRGSARHQCDMARRRLAALLPCVILPISCRRSALAHRDRAGVHFGAPAVELSVVPLALAFALVLFVLHALAFALGLFVMHKIPALALAHDAVISIAVVVPTGPEIAALAVAVRRLEVPGRWRASGMQKVDRCATVGAGGVQRGGGRAVIRARSAMAIGGCRALVACPICLKPFVMVPTTSPLLWSFSLAPTLSWGIRQVPSKT